MFYLTTHSTHFIYGYMVSDIWLRTILIVRKETRCRHIVYSYRLTARVLLYAPSHRQDNTAFVTPVVEHWLEREIAQWVHPMKNRSDDPSHHERALYLWATSRSLNTHWKKTIDTYFVGFNDPEIKNGIHRQGNVIWNRHRALWTPYTCMFISIFLFLHPIKRRLISDIILSHINLLT